jgi:hypothetical protein
MKKYPYKLVVETETLADLAETLENLRSCIHDHTIGPSDRQVVSKNDGGRYQMDNKSIAKPAKKSKA